MAISINLRNSPKIEFSTWSAKLFFLGVSKYTLLKFPNPRKDTSLANRPHMYRDFIL